MNSPGTRLASWAVPRRPCQNYGTQHSLPDAYREKWYGAAAGDPVSDSSLQQSLVPLSADHRQRQNKVIKEVQLVFSIYSSIGLFPAFDVLDGV